MAEFDVFFVGADSLSGMGTKCVRVSEYDTETDLRTNVCNEFEIKADYPLLFYRLDRRTSVGTEGGDTSDALVTDTLHPMGQAIQLATVYASLRKYFDSDLDEAKLLAVLKTGAIGVKPGAMLDVPGITNVSAAPSHQQSDLQNSDAREKKRRGPKRSFDWWRNANIAIRDNMPR
jgi:hypothetical protein